MPYIEQHRRAELLSRTYSPATPGDANFMITSFCNAMLAEWGVNYGNINLLIGALECAKLELYRRIAAPYEDKKIEVNGDVYDTTD